MAQKLYYQAEVSHKGLNKYRIVKASTSYELEQKTKALKSQWDAEWAKKVEREKKIQEEASAISYAQQATEEATSKLLSLENILSSSLLPKRLCVDDLKDFSKFSKKKPAKPILKGMPTEPKQTDRQFSYIPFFIKFFESYRNKREEANLNRFQTAHINWEKRCKQITETNTEKEKQYEITYSEWQKEETDFYKKQTQKNNEIEAMFDGIAKKEESCVENGVAILLGRISTPLEYERDILVEYNKGSDMLIVDISLPTIEDMPKLKSVNYIKSRKEFKETFLSEAAIKKLYESTIYQIVLQTLNYVFDFGKQHSIFDAVVINGKICTVDKSTGKSIEPYILSVTCNKADFEQLNLSAIDPKSWFKSSKGVSAATLATVTPVAPIVTMNKHDDRFVEEYSVVNYVSEGTNLAAMDWQDFENLVRELFEQEFAVSGGEVKITQASRDGGVDAIAFDPDPIRGGKIVIQAKRYTNVVGVSAVRDLYGTVMNEGATKGILVTTSNYGSDAYDFAKGKPLTLLNGANLLSLIQKHGHNAYINLGEAKKLLNKF